MATAVRYEWRGGVPALQASTVSTGPFTWSRGGTCAWVSRPVGGVDVPFLAELSPPVEDYSPSEGMARRFAALADHPAEEMFQGMKDFSERYGPLGVPELIPGDPRLAKYGAIFAAARKFAEPGLGEPFGVWWKQVRDVRNALGLVERLRSGTPVDSFVRWGELRYHADGATVAGDRMRPHLCVQKSRFASLSETFRLDEADCEPVEGEFEVRDPVRAVLGFLRERLDHSLQSWGEVRVGEDLGLAHRPRNLLGFIWFEVLEEARALPEWRACARCGKLFAKTRARARQCPGCKH